MAVADVVEAMSRFRPYREALGEERAIEEIRAKRGTLFDPDAVDACLSILESGHAFEVSV
jgi:HD-GYP domain-containing protein (c-di-GMP phosphodiesterase class II)